MPRRKPSRKKRRLVENKKSMRTVEGFLGLYRLTYHFSSIDRMEKDVQVLVRVRRAVEGESEEPISLIVEEVEGRVRQIAPDSMQRVMPKGDIVFRVVSVRLGRANRETGKGQAIFRGRVEYANSFVVTNTGSLRNFVIQSPRPLHI